MDDDFIVNPLHDQNANQKVLLVNLSALHYLNSDISVLNEFLTLGTCIISDFVEHAIKYKLFDYYKNTIDQYKIGKISPNEFIEALLKESHFKFHDSYFDDSKMSNFFNQNKNELYFFRDVTTNDFNLLSKPDKIQLTQKALMEKAWNSLISFNEKDSCNCCGIFSKRTLSAQERFQKIIQYAEAKNINIIHITSSTNVMHAYYIFQYFFKQNKNLFSEEHLNTMISSKDKNIDLQCKHSTIKIQFWPSYTNHVFKNKNTTTLTTPLLNAEKTEENHKTPASTADILAHICNQVSIKDAELISQWSEDIKRGKELGIKNCIESKKFFSEQMSASNNITQNNLAFQ